MAVAVCQGPVEPDPRLASVQRPFLVGIRQVVVLAAVLVAAHQDAPRKISAARAIRRQIARLTRVRIGPLVVRPRVLGCAPTRTLCLLGEAQEPKATAVEALVAGAPSPCATSPPQPSLATAETVDLVRLQSGSAEAVRFVPRAATGPRPGLRASEDR